MRRTMALLLLVPLATAQGAWHTFTDDPPLDGGMEISTDMLAVRMEEEDGTLRFDVQGAATDPDEAAYHLRFTHVGVAGSTDIAIVVDGDGVHTYHDGMLFDTQTYGGGQGPGRFPVSLATSRVLGGYNIGDAFEDFYAISTLDGRGASYQEPEAWDRAPDNGFGEPYTLRFGGPASAEAVEQQATSTVGASWTVLEGPDFAGAPSIAIDDDVHIAFQIYDGGRGNGAGLYHATYADGALEWAYVAPSHDRIEDCRDHCSRTAIAVEDAVHILYQPDPRSDQGIRHATDAGGDWSAVDPLAGTGLTHETGHRSIPAIAAEAGRVIAALQVTGERVAIMEYDGTWSLLETIDDARFADLAIDRQGGLHVAWLDITDEERESGDINYAGPDGVVRSIAGPVKAQTVFWETSETDGTWDFALTPDDVPAFVWELDHPKERAFATLTEEGLEKTASPIQPIHGNPQLRMLMDFDAAGNAHFATGYGGLDLYATRNTQDGWFIQDFDRVDVFDFAVHPDGRAIIVGTGPHGGTTLEVWEAKAAPDSQDITAGMVLRDGSLESIPLNNSIPAPGLAVVAVALALLARRV